MYCGIENMHMNKIHDNNNVKAKRREIVLEVLEDTYTIYKVLNPKGSRTITKQF